MLSAFFNCSSVVLSNQIKLFLGRNLQSWVDLFDEDHKERLPVLKMYLTFENQRVKFFPSYEDLEELIVFVAQQIMDSLQKVSIRLQITFSYFDKKSVVYKLHYDARECRYCDQLGKSASILIHVHQPTVGKRDHLSQLVMHTLDIGHTFNCGKVPTIQSWLHQQANNRYIDGKVPDHIASAALTKLRNAAKSNFQKPLEFFQKTIVEPYSYLFDGTESKAVDAFLKEDGDFLDYKNYITKLHNLAQKVMLLPDAEYFDLIRLDCEDVKVGLSKECQRLANTLLERVATKLRQTNKEICDCFEEMQTKCRTIPQNSEELVEMNQYMEEARCQGMVRMENKIRWTRDYLTYLLDVYDFTPEDIKQNSQVLTWKSRIYPEFDANDKLQERMRAVNESRIYGRREKLAAELERLRNRVDEFNDYGEIDDEMMAQYVNDVRAVYKRLADAENERMWINKEEALYQIPFTPFNEIEEIKGLVDPFQKLFTMCVKYYKSERKEVKERPTANFSAESDTKVAMSCLFDKLDAEVIEAQVDEYWREIFRLQKVFTMRLKKMRMEAAERKQASRPRRRREPDSEESETEEVKPPAALATITIVLERIRKFKDTVPIIGILCNPGIRQRHWDAMSAIAKRDLTPDSGTSLAKVLQMNLDPYMDQFEAISAGASKEHTLEVNMKKMLEDWKDVEFTLTPYRDTGISILASVDEIQQQLDDQIVKTQTMRGSPFIKPFEAEIKKWEERLLRIQDTIDSWLSMQANWLYLEPIFSSEDIMQQMPEEGRLFQAVDRNYKDIMRNTAIDTHVLKATAFAGLLERIKDSNTLLDKINKGLNAYLEKKRLFFPRFFFLSNDEMLEILSETKDPLRVQPHLKKCFEGIAKLEFDKNLEIKAMFSSEGEKVVFSKVNFPLYTAAFIYCSTNLLFFVMESLVGWTI
ncbi:unnamed protein product [Dibothriocephalus latus]|uniref:Dynein heavy chain linker domain-containing protein n=1 Tax=Dibothriocephalus latus TaxID=60516 RepID=A0A3P6UQJ3_DIBLA|nr:unnamed protein product [Dibothriocephalus latus]